MRLPSCYPSEVVYSLDWFARCLKSHGQLQLAPSRPPGLFWLSLQPAYGKPRITNWPHPSSTRLVVRIGGCDWFGDLNPELMKPNGRFAGGPSKPPIKTGSLHLSLKKSRREPQNHETWRPESCTRADPLSRSGRTFEQISPV